MKILCGEKMYRSMVMTALRRRAEITWSLQACLRAHNVSAHKVKLFWDSQANHLANHYYRKMLYIYV